MDVRFVPIPRFEYQIVHRALHQPLGIASAFDVVVINPQNQAACAGVNMQKLRKLTGNYACLCCGAIMPTADCEKHSWVNGSNFYSVLLPPPLGSLLGFPFLLGCMVCRGTMDKASWKTILPTSGMNESEWRKLYGHLPQDGTDEIGEALESLTQRHQ